MRLIGLLTFANLVASNSQGDSGVPQSALNGAGRSAYSQVLLACADHFGFEGVCVGAGAGREGVGLGAGREGAGDPLISFLILME